MTRFSLIVCSRGRCGELVDLFVSLSRQGRRDFELILVDQNEDGRLTQVVVRFADQFTLRHIRIAGSGASLARNVGLDHAVGELIGFPDDDCHYLDDYLDKVDEIFSHEPSIDCICGSPTSTVDKQHGSGCFAGRMDLSAVGVLDRCQEFTIFVRREKLRHLRFNERLGVGAQTLWGAEEGPDLLMRLVEDGSRLVFFPQLFVYHPDKLAQVTRSTLERAAGYSRGRGCLFRLHRFPRRVVFRSLIRPAIGSALYLLTFQTMRSAYYFAVVCGLLRGLLMSKAELATVREGSRSGTGVQPIALRPLPPEPLVTVLIGNYNYARYLPAALDSLLAQTYTNWHAVVCDDGSTDNSVPVIQQYAGQDPRIQLVTKTNGGQVSAMNAGYPHVFGEIVSLLDTDDLFDARKIESVVECFRANPEAGICNHFSQVIDADGNLQSVTMHRFLDEGWLANLAMQRGACVYIPTTSCISLRRQVADAIFPIGCQQVNDVDGYLGMVAQLLSPICVLHEPLSQYRVHGNNLGGLSEPTPMRLQYELQLIETRTENVKEFARQRFGERIAEKIALKDNPQYLQAALKLLAIERVDCRWARAVALIQRHPSAAWRAIWRAIFAVPPPLGRRAVPWMHRSYKMKALFHSLLGRRKAPAT